MTIRVLIADDHAVVLDDPRATYESIRRAKAASPVYIDIFNKTARDTLKAAGFSRSRRRAKS